MSGAPGIDVVAERISAGLHRAKSIVAFVIREHAATAAEIGIDGREIGVVLVPIASAGVRLPELNKGARHAETGLVAHMAVHDNALADGLPGFRVVEKKVVVERPEFVRLKDRAGDFGQGVCKDQSGMRGERNTLVL